MKRLLSLMLTLLLTAGLMLPCAKAAVSRWGRWN